MTNLTLATSSPRDACPEARAGAIRHVLVCLDRSPSSDACLPYARFFAAAFAAKVTLLHVLRQPSAVHEPDRPDALGWEIEKREAERYLSEAIHALGGASSEAVTRVTQGFPAAQIVATAREVGADVTILSSHGQGNDGALDLGSIAQHVLARGGGSVLLTQPTTGISRRIPPNRILVPLDGSVRAECVLPLVAELARAHGAAVVLVHVVMDPTPSGVLSAQEDLALASSLASHVEAGAAGYLARIRARLLPQIPSLQTLVVRRAEERQALLDVAREQEADMLVLTAHGSTCNVERAFGSVASYVLAHAPLPVFVFQDMPRSPRISNSDAPPALRARAQEAD
jgi:nucleotide-binding universal stress UspA family protein